MLKRFIAKTRLCFKVMFKRDGMILIYVPVEFQNEYLLGGEESLTVDVDYVGVKKPVVDSLMKRLYGDN